MLISKVVLFFLNEREIYKLFKCKIYHHYSYSILGAGVVIMLPANSKKLQVLIVWIIGRKIASWKDSLFT